MKNSVIGLKRGDIVLDKLNKKPVMLLNDVLRTSPDIFSIRVTDKLDGNCRNCRHINIKYLEPLSRAGKILYGTN